MRRLRALGMAAAVAVAAATAQAGADDDARLALAQAQAAQARGALQIELTRGAAEAVARAADRHVDAAAAAALVEATAAYADAVQAWGEAAEAHVAAQVPAEAALATPAGIAAALADLPRLPPPPAGAEAALQLLEERLASQSARRRLDLERELDALGDAYLALASLRPPGPGEPGVAELQVKEAWLEAAGRLATLEALGEITEQLRATRLALPRALAAAWRPLLRQRLADLALAGSSAALAAPSLGERIPAYHRIYQARLAALRPPWKEMLFDAHAPQLAQRQCRSWAAEIEAEAASLATLAPHPAFHEALDLQVRQERVDARGCQLDAEQIAARLGDRLAPVRLSVVRARQAARRGRAPGPEASACSTLGAAIEASGGAEEADVWAFLQGCPP